MEEHAHLYAHSLATKQVLFCTTDLKTICQELGCHCKRGSYARRDSKILF